MTKACAGILTSCKHRIIKCRRRITFRKEPKIFYLPNRFVGNCNPFCKSMDTNCSMKKLSFRNDQMILWIRDPHIWELKMTIFICSSFLAYTHFSPITAPCHANRGRLNPWDWIGYTKRKRYVYFRSIHLVRFVRKPINGQRQIPWIWISMKEAFIEKTISRLPKRRNAPKSPFIPWNIILCVWN